MREPSSWSERGPCLHIVMVWCDDSAGVVEQGKGTEGSPGTWEILSSPWKKSRSGTPGNKTPGPSFLHSATTGDTKRAECSRGIAKRRQRSAARRARGSRSAPIVPSKPGNLLERTRWREAGRQVTKPPEGNMPETSNSESVSTRQQPIAMLAKQNPQMAFTLLLNHC